MSKAILALAAVLSISAATPALAQYDEVYPYVLSYRPFRVQIEGGRMITQGSQDRYFDNGFNVGLGFTWQPTAHLPLAVRVDGMYASIEMRPPLLAQASSIFGTRVDEGSAKLWGGDADAELHFPLGEWARLYLLAGAGWYDERNSYRQLNFATGQFCGTLTCTSRVVQTSTLVARTSTGMRFEENAGVGVELAMGDRASFFVDARYMRFSPNGDKRDFIPIRFGLRY